jgi:hypothetical protein
MAKRRTTEELRAAYVAKLEALNQREEESKAKESADLTKSIAKLEAQHENIVAAHNKATENYERRLKGVDVKLSAARARLAELSDDSAE